MKKISMIALTLMMGAASVFAQGWGRPPVEDPTGYKDTYKDYFTVGVAVNINNVPILIRSLLSRRTSTASQLRTT